MRSVLFLMVVAACGGGSGTTASGSPDSGPGGGPVVDGPPGGGGSDSGTTPDSGSYSNATGPYFTVPMFFNQDVSNVAKSSHSDAMIAQLAAEGGWGNGNTMQIDTSIEVLTANAATPMMTFTPTSDFFSPDCDHVPMPVPAGGNVENNPGYACLDDGDCHLLVADAGAGKLFEMWRANIVNGQFDGGCLAVWNLDHHYTDTLRGDQCTSADAAGFPISPLLFTADEVAAGHIDHAIRFILPNSRTRVGYTRPATHGTSTTGGSAAPAYGVHLRLRADYPIDSLPSEGAKVVARAMQKYGMYHADGGNIALTARSDQRTTHKWAGLLGSHDLAALKITDFEVIDHGSTIPLTGDCVRN
jgi:serine/threonine-protein kinase